MIPNQPVPSPYWEDYTPEPYEWPNEGEPDIGQRYFEATQQGQVTNGQQDYAPPREPTNGHQSPIRAAKQVIGSAINALKKVTLSNGQGTRPGASETPELDIDELVRSAQIPIEVPVRDVPFVKPIELSEVLEPLGIDLVLDCFGKGEYGDAQLFASLYEGRLVFDGDVEKQWYLWGGHYWEPDHLGTVRLLVHGPLASQYMHAAAILKQHIDTPREKNPYARFFSPEGDLSAQIDERINGKAGLLARASRLRFKNRRNNILETAERMLAVRNKVWDANPWLLGCQNGVLSLKRDDTWFRNGQPEDHIRTIAPTTWEGIEQHDLMTWFIPSLFDNKPEGDKQAMTSYLRRFFGYGLTGLTREDTFAILWGDEGRNGKDTLLKMIEQTLGSEMAGPVDKAVIIDGKKKSGGGTSSHIMALRGKRLVWVNETKEGEVLSAGQVKYLTGGGTIGAL